MKVLRDERGLTLTELIVTIVLFSIVTSLIFTIMNSNIGTYTVADEQVDNQSALRLLAYRITDELRNARHLELLPDTSSVTLEQHLYLHDNIVKQNNEIGNIVPISDDLIQSISYTAVVKNDKVVLQVHITSLNGMTLDTEVLLNNITSVLNSSGYVIEYDFNAP